MARADQDTRRLATLEPAPVLRPLTWAGVELACARLVTLGDGSDEVVAVTLAGLLRAEPEAVAVADPEGFLEVAIADGDPGLAIARRQLPLGVVADLALQAFREACSEANRSASVYGAARRAQMPESYRGLFLKWAEPDGSASARSLASSLASRGPEAWAVLEDWPLDRTLRFLEDLAVSSFLDELDEMTAEAGVGRRV